MVDAVHLRSTSVAAQPTSVTALRDRASVTTIDDADFERRFVPLRESLSWAPPALPAAPAADPSNATGGAARSSAITPTFAPTVGELSLLARDVWADVPESPGGYRVAQESDLANLGLRSQDLGSSQSGFRARVYMRDGAGSGEAARYVVAFRGSAGPSDLGSGVRQGASLSSDHHARALTIGQRLRQHPDADVTLTGHTLGGGLASAAAIASDRDATTFNASGLSHATLDQADALRDRGDLGRAVQVAAFYIRGEVLSAIQDGGDRMIGAFFGGKADAYWASASSAYNQRVALDAVAPAGMRW